MPWEDGDDGSVVGLPKVVGALVVTLGYLDGNGTALVGGDEDDG